MPANTAACRHAPGRVEVTWAVERTEQGLTLVLDWKERNGPPPKRNRRPGFGSRLIHMVIERQLNGEVLQSFGPEGMEAKLTVPLTHERWPGRVCRRPCPQARRPDPPGWPRHRFRTPPRS